MSKTAPSTQDVAGLDRRVTGHARHDARDRDAGSAGARATAEWRRRRQQGAALVTVEISAEDIELLIARRWLAADEARDRRGVGDAVTRLLDRVFGQLGSRLRRA
jgi:hypothetical protein